MTDIKIHGFMFKHLTQKIMPKINIKKSRKEKSYKYDVGPLDKIYKIDYKKAQPDPHSSNLVYTSTRVLPSTAEVWKHKA